jgi:hypothetical protein
MGDTIGPRGLQVPDLEEVQKENYKAALQACRSIDKVIYGDVSVKERGKKYIPVYFRLSYLTLMFSEVRVDMSKAENLIAEGKEKEALQLIRQAVEKMDKYRDILENSDKIFESWPTPPARYDAKKSWKEVKFYGEGAGNENMAGVKYEKLKQELASFEGNMDVLRSGINAKVKSKELLNKPLPVVTAKMTEKVITVDGNADEKCWEDAVWQKDFVYHNKLQYGRNPTKAACAYDKENLYFFFKGDVLQEGFPRAESNSPDKWVPTDSYFEIMISPDVLKGYFQIYVNPRGVIGDVYYELPPEKAEKIKNISDAQAAAVGEEVKYPRPQSHSSWESKVKAGVKVGDNYWQVEMAVPFSSLKTGNFSDIKEPENGSEWKVNLCRSIPKTSMFLPEYINLSRSGFGDYMDFVKLEFLK